MQRSLIWLKRLLATALATVPGKTRSFVGGFGGKGKHLTEDVVTRTKNISSL